MNIIETIRNDRNRTRKAQNSELTMILSTFIGEIERSPTKDFSDQAVISLIKKTLSNYDQMVHKTVGQLYEIEVLERYLPRQLSYDELIGIFETVKPADVKTWMSYLKEYYPGLYDGRIASEIFKNNA